MSWNIPRHFPFVNVVFCQRMCYTGCINTKGWQYMKTLFIIFLALILVFLMLAYVFALAITSDDLETDIKIEKEIWDNYEKTKKNIF